MKDVRERIGRVVWPALRASRGEAALDALAPFFAEFPPGGCIVFGEGCAQVERLLATLRLRAGRPLLVAADLERGAGQQVREATALPPAMALAACPDPEAARVAGRLTGSEARAAGIDVVFAPVVDVNSVATNPIIATRSFGDDPHRVARLASAFAAGVREGGALPVAKHFPGHGATVQDSHDVLARVPRTAEELEAIDLLPFRTLIAENIEGLMVGHLEVPALDPVPGRPATRSPNIVLDLLRRQLGYDGLVVTDALDMGGFPQDPAVAVDVLQAGLDVLLMPRDPLATARALADAHARGWLADEVLDGAVARVKALAARRPASPRPVLVPQPELAERLLAASLTRGGPPLPRLLPGRAVEITVYGEDGGIAVPAFCEALAAAGVPRLGDAGTDAPAGPLLRIGLVLTTVRAWLGRSRLPELDRRRLQWAVAHGKLDAVVILGSPYELLELPPRQPALLAYEPSALAAVAAVRVLLGEVGAPGRLPVSASPRPQA